MVTLPFRYPLDPTGTNPDNLVVGEVHTLVNRTVRAVALQYGAFFTESLVVRDTATNQVLTRGTQYVATELFAFPTGRYGKEICGIILIKDQSVSSEVSIDYQALGGDYGTNVDAIIQMLNSAELDNRPVAWPDIINKPDEFEPAAHYHDAGDIYGFEYVTHAIERVRDAILMGDSASHDEILRYIDSRVGQTDDRLDDLEAALASHVNNTNNPHNTTKAHVGLGNVQNYPIATNQQAIDGTGNAYITPGNLSAAITALAVTPLSNHVNNSSNPHNTTKAQVGLGSVDNFATASQTEAQNGAVNDKFMTPLRTAQAISTQVGQAVAAHANRQDNPHQTTATQVGLGNVANYRVANEVEARAGTDNGLYMTPLRTAQAINQMAPALNHTHEFATLTNKPTTAAGYGMVNVDAAGSMSSAGTMRVGTTPGNGYVATQSGSNTKSGYVEYYGPNGVRVGYTGFADNAGSTDQGTMNYVGAIHNFTGTVRASGDLQGYASDERLKTNFRKIENPLNKLAELVGWIYDWDQLACAEAGFEYENITEHGLGAQTVQKVVPDAVVPAAFNKDFLTVKYHRLVPLLVAGVNELRAELQAVVKSIR